MKRIGVFVFYDKDGIVDTYIEFFLSALKAYLERLVIVCNGRLSEEGRKRFEQFTDDIFIRENSGYDAMAYKLAMTTYIGWTALKEYDELLLVNDTFYGPVYPLNEMFTALDKKECDFWGITCHKEYIDYYSGDAETCPSYIQSYFMGFRKNIFISEAFQTYWNTFDSTRWIFSDILNRHEKNFTSAMEQSGFSWDTYVHASEYESTKPENNFIQYYYITYQLIKDCKCPFIKKKNFITKHLTANPGELGNDTSKAFLWIRENTDYPTDVIWENLLRLYDINDIRKALNLNYIIPGHSEPGVVSAGKVIAVVCTDSSLTIQQEQYIQLLKTYMDVIDRQGIMDNRINGLFDVNARWEYVLFLTDMGNLNNRETALHKYSAIEEQWGNLIGENSYTAEIINLFSENNRLGMLQAPSGIYGASFGRRSTVQSEGPLAFWCRKNIFQKMKSEIEALAIGKRKGALEEFQAHFSRTAQHMGYYTAVGMNASYASMAYTNMDEMLRQIVTHTKSRYKFEDFGSYLDGDMLSFCEKYNRIYVYGAGENGCRAANLIIMSGHVFSGFIVSDDQPETEEKNGYPIYRLSKIADSLNQAGIVVSVTSRKFQIDILRQLRQRGFKNIYLLDT